MFYFFDKKNPLFLHFSKSLLFWTIYLLANSCFGQDQATPIHFDHLTFQKGLSHNTVFCLLQDKHGYIWAGTQNGLNKYDGYTFEVFRSNFSKEEKEGFKGRSIYSLMEDSQGNLWVGTRNEGINFRANLSDHFINLQTDTTFSVLNGYDITSFYEDKQGNIWISSKGGGLLRYNLDSKKSTHYTVKNSGLSSDFVFDTVQNEEGTIWVATAGEGLNYLVKNNWFNQIHVKNKAIPDIQGYSKTLLLDDKYLWIATEGTGLYRMDIQTQTFTHFGLGQDSTNVSSNTIRDIYKKGEDQIYIATDGSGLNIYDKATNKVLKHPSSIDQPNSINSNALYCLLEDRMGNMWIGTYNGGINIFKIKKTFFDYYSPAAGQVDELGHQSILSIHQGKDDKIWVGTDGGGLYWFDSEKNQFSPNSFHHNPSDDNSLLSNVVKGLWEDQQNRLWLGAFGIGASRYDPSDNTFKHFGFDSNNPDGLAGNIIWSIAEQKNGDLWFGTLDGGICILNPTTDVFNSYRHNPDDPHSLSENSVMVIFVDQEDTVWIGTADKGLNRWNSTTQKFDHFIYDMKISTSISSNDIRAIFQDSEGQLWIGTESGGLNKWLGDGQFEHIGEREGLIANSVMGITESTDGKIWLSTFEGLSQLDKQTKEIRNFDFRTNQNNNQFNQMAILTSQNGKLFFGGINGLHAINPEQLETVPENAPILFTDLKIFNQSIVSGQEINKHVVLEYPIEDSEIINLNYLENSFSIDFAAIDYTDPLGNKFSYKMEGFDPVWQSTAAGQHSSSYTNLDYGTYTFKVKNGLHEKHLQIKIHPPLWQRLWFKLLILFSILGLLVFLIIALLRRNEGIYKRKVLEAESELLQFKNQKLSEEVSDKNSELMYSAVQMAHKNEILQNIKQELKEGKNESNKEFRSLIRMVDKELTNEDYWKEFNLYFNQVDKDFVQALIGKHPKLTQNDIRICTLMRIQLSTKEISSLLNISVRAVEQSRYRLKKRLELHPEKDLNKYIASFPNDI